MDRGTTEVIVHAQLKTFLRKSFRPVSLQLQSHRRFKLLVAVDVEVFYIAGILERVPEVSAVIWESRVVRIPEHIHSRINIPQERWIGADRNHGRRHRFINEVGINGGIARKKIS